MTAIVNSMEPRNHKNVSLTGMSNEINITINKDDLTCIVCLDELTCEIYRCFNGPHFMCGKCSRKYYSCLLCKCEYIGRDLFIENIVKK